MKNLMICMLLASGFLGGCQAQQKDHEALAQNFRKFQNDTIKPEGKWTVNKEVDEHGNIIRYDSIYTWSSSRGFNGFSQAQIDSIMGSYSSIFERHFSSMDGSLFENDSIINDFFGDNFSGPNSGMPNFDQIRNMMQKMEERFMRNAPGRPLLPAEPDEKPEKL
ncbi:hypothetical protein [Robertkochia solimangrovi]|uniref:hypothetical protein n=1 Tax=Robertkochia solimangrovi TaxID=2213046 RepID=UPI00117F112F|nr:hypothetical protein [Robertkochia solimangrovi]TRZ42038.1 hypothetical protein DMZ48_15500 [Robertkochia solimangrovi]